MFGVTPLALWGCCMQRSEWSRFASDFAHHTLMLALPLEMDGPDTIVGERHVGIYTCRHDRRLRDAHIHAHWRVGMVCMQFDTCYTPRPRC